MLKRESLFDGFIAAPHLGARALSRSPSICGEGLGMGVTTIRSLRRIRSTLTSTASFARLGPRRGAGKGVARAIGHTWSSLALQLSALHAFVKQQGREQQ